MRLPRDEILAATDLHALADDLLGPRRRGGWSCPAPGHGTQTGATPPVHIYTTTRGEQRWHCHACGTGGTAIDLLMLTQGLRIRDALETLAVRAAISPDTTPINSRGSPRAKRAVPRDATTQRERAPEPAPALEEYVHDCEAFLWSPAGKPVRDWLHGRGLSREVLQANRVGGDPGPARMSRAPGLPRGGIGAVFPVIDEQDRAVYAQLRYLHPRAGGAKYANPTSTIARLPRWAEVRTPNPTGRAIVVVCEGLPDALSAAQAGARAAALLGTGLAGAHAAAEVHARFPNEHLVIALDADQPGRNASDRLVNSLQAQHHRSMARLEIPEPYHDLNAWLRGDAAGFVNAMQARTALTRARESKAPAPTMKIAAPRETSLDLA